MRHSKPREVFKLFLKNSKCSDKARKESKWPFQIFLRACSLCDVCTDSKEVTFSLLETTFSISQAILYFNKKVGKNTNDQKESTQFLELHFLENWVKCLNDNVLLKLSSKLAALWIGFKHFLDHGSHFYNIRNRSSEWAEVIAKTIAVIRSVECFLPVGHNPSKELHNRDLSPRTCVTKADRVILLCVLITTVCTHRRTMKNRFLHRQKFF